MNRKINILFYYYGNYSLEKIALYWATFFHSNQFSFYAVSLRNRDLKFVFPEELPNDLMSMKSFTLSEVEDLLFDYVISLGEASEEMLPHFLGSPIYYQVGIEDLMLINESVDDSKVKEFFIKSNNILKNQIKNFEFTR